MNVLALYLFGFIAYRLVEVLVKLLAGRRTIRSYTVRSRPWRWYLLTWVVAAVFPLAVMVALFVDGSPIGWLWAAVLVILLKPWSIARLVLIPLGWVRTSCYVVSIPNFPWRDDPSGGAMVAAALARRQQRRVRTATELWLSAKLDALQMLRGGGAVASALLTEVGGDRELARAKMQAALDFDPRTCPRAARRLAAHWLLLEAAERGAWQRVVECASSRALRFDRGAWLLGGVARRLLGETGAPGDVKLQLLRVLAPWRRRTGPLVTRALNIPRATQSAPPFEAPSSVGDPVVQALDLHVAYLLQASVRVQKGSLAAVASAWQDALDHKSAADLLQPSVEDAMAELVASAPETALGLPSIRLPPGEAPIRLPPGEPGALLTNAAWGAMESRDRELILTVEALASRLEREFERRPAGELADWCAIRRLYYQTAQLSGIESRRTAFAGASGVIWNQAVWLFNTLGQKPLANAMFHWLLDEAQATGNVRTMEAMESNIKISF